MYHLQPMPYSDSVASFVLARKRPTAMFQVYGVSSLYHSATDIVSASFASILPCVFEYFDCCLVNCCVVCDKNRPFVEGCLIVESFQHMHGQADCCICVGPTFSSSGLHIYMCTCISSVNLVHPLYTIYTSVVQSADCCIRIFILCEVVWSIVCRVPSSSHHRTCCFTF